MPLNICTSLEPVRHVSRHQKFRRRRTDLERHISLCHIRALRRQQSAYRYRHKALWPAEDAVAATADVEMLTPS